MHYMKSEIPVIGTSDFHFDKRNVISDTSGDYQKGIKADITMHVSQQNNNLEK